MLTAARRSPLAQLGEHGDKLPGLILEIDPGCRGKCRFHQACSLLRELLRARARELKPLEVTRLTKNQIGIDRDDFSFSTATGRDAPNDTGSIKRVPAG